MPQKVTPVMKAESSPLSADVAASSMRAKPSDREPIAILSMPRAVMALARRSGSPGAARDGHGLLGERSALR